MDSGQANQHHTAMNNTSVIAFIILLTGSFLSGFFGPWWAPAVFTLLTTILLGLNTRQAILLGSVSMGITYLLMAIWMHTSDDADILAKSGMLLGGLSPGLLMVVTVSIGGLTGLLSGWLGSTLGAVVSRK
jgi:hypothetical protein